ncbi:MAG: hypothetical protein KBD50_01200 [Candidatus Pacebacteria bacterium]|nr:hypothetical protein [Candidatus Paceibacterota bacterium]
MDDIKELRNLIVAELIDPILYLLFGLGLLVFVFGVAEFIYGLSAQTEARSNGKKHMLWGLVGMFIMMTAVSIVKLIAQTVGGST